MATQVGYTLQCENFEINSIEDIDRLLSENIIPAYDENLLRVNTCIDIFKQIETERSLSEIFCDYTAGKRKRINPKRLLNHLEDMENELSEGMEMYMMLLGQGEEVRKYLKNTKVTKFKLDKTETKSKTSPVKEFAIPAIAVIGPAAGSGVVGAAGGAAGGALLAHYAGIVIPASMLIKAISTKAAVTTATAGTVVTSATGLLIGAGVGLVVVGIAAVFFIIYKIAKYKGKERGLKYQQVKELYDALNDGNVLSTIKTNNKKLKYIFDAINKQLHSDEAYLQMTVGVYLEERENSLRELEQDNPEMSAEMRRNMSEIVATTACKTYLRHKTEYSEEKIKRCIQAIKRNLAERLNQEIGPANDVLENNAENQGQEQNGENLGQNNNGEN